MLNITKFKELMIGIFYLTATLILLSGSFVMYTQWQDLWSEGFSDFKNISEAIVDLKDSTKPISNIAPHVLTEMTAMNEKIALMQVSVQRMESSVTGLNMSVYNMSHTVPNQMHDMENQMSPWNMMSPFN
jgi:hypothetical protein